MGWVRPSERIDDLRIKRRSSSPVSPRLSQPQCRPKLATWVVQPQRLILASSSPRRSEILSRLGLQFDVEPADVDESVRVGEDPLAYVKRLAMDKAEASRQPGTITIAADTSVILNGSILGKPTDAAHAAEMLAQLSGTRHQVITGVAVAVANADGSVRMAVDSETTEVDFTAITPDRIDWYASLLEPLDKAGSYGMQGAGSLFADRINGSVTNVIGLPIQLVDRLFSELGIDLLAFAPRGEAGPAS